MVKILKAGKKPTPTPPWYLSEVFECDTCGAQWQLETGDPTMNVDGMLGSSCPTCGDVATLSPPPAEGDQ